MRIEAFTAAKTPDDPAGNEDQLLILPGRGHAVIDGVTDRTGHRYDGLLAGRYVDTVDRVLDDEVGGVPGVLRYPRATR